MDGRTLSYEFEVDENKSIAKRVHEYVERGWSSDVPEFEFLKDLEEGTLKQRAVALGSIIFAPVKLLWGRFVEEGMYVEGSGCPVCNCKRKERHVIAHCPECKAPAHSNGSVHGIQRFTCFESVHPKPHSFTINTSAEHSLFLYFCALRTLEYLGQGMPLEGIQRIMGVTRWFTELVISAAAEQLKDRDFGKISKDFIVVYIDGVYAVRGCIIVAKIRDKILWKCCEGEDYQSIKSHLLQLKDCIDAETIMFVTDGLINYVDAVREVFPDAIHVRHFHSTIEDILVHFPYEDDLYTLHMKWDIFIEGGRKNVTLWKGIKYLLDRKKEKKKRDKRANIVRLREIVESINKHGRRWDGRLMQRFSVRVDRVADEVISGKTDVKNLQDVLSKIEWNLVSLKFRHRLQERIYVVYVRIDRKELKWIQRKRKKRVEKLYMGELSDVAEKYPQIDHVLGIMRKEFEGKHITTNPVEGTNSHFLPLLRTHRSEKGTQRLINVILHLRFSLHALEHALHIDMFKTSIIKRNQYIGIEIGKPYWIKYRDNSNRVTTRRIHILSFDGKKRIDAYCYLRNESRTFRRDRIIKAIPMSAR